MKTTPSPSFPVEKQKAKLDGYAKSLEAKKHVEQLTKGVFAKETITGGITPPSDLRFFFWRPNNYRLKISKIKGLDGGLEIKGVPPLFHMEKKGTVQTIKLNDNLTLQVCRSCVVGIWSLRKGKNKLYYKVNVDSVATMDEWINNKVLEIENALTENIRLLNLPLDYNSSVWIKHEDGIKGEEFIDSLPRDLYLNDTYVKKVYSDELEAKAPTYVKNHFANTMLERASPQIVKELQEIKVLLTSYPQKDEKKEVTFGEVASLNNSCLSDEMCGKCGYNATWCNCREPLFKSASISRVWTVGGRLLWD